MLKHETIERLIKQRAKEQTARRLDLAARLSEKAMQEGPESIWAELLAELSGQNPQHS